MIILNTLQKRPFLIAIIVMGLSTLMLLPTAKANVVYHVPVGHRHWHHANRWHHWHGRYRRGVGPGAFIAATFGFLAGAAIAGQEHYRCRRTYVNCYTHYGYYGPVRQCYRSVRWVC